MGWDLKKALYLLRKSNPSILEWLNSPIIYHKDQEFFKKTTELAEKSFNTKTLMYHYLHMAKSNYREYLKTDLVKLKKYFYVIRPIFALKWLEKNRFVPPINFNELFNNIQIERNVRKDIEKLLAVKKEKKNLDYIQKSSP